MQRFQNYALGQWVDGDGVETNVYNANTGEKIKTSTLRHCIELLLPNEAAKIEPIMEDVFGISNEYWVSFWVDEVMYDKKFVFPPESICEKNLKTIKQLGAPGIMIQ